MGGALLVGAEGEEPQRRGIEEGEEGEEGTRRAQAAAEVAQEGRGSASRRGEGARVHGCVREEQEAPPTLPGISPSSPSSAAFAGLGRGAVL